ncbi:Hypothetical predicted protein [Pelobates cultripes]|uniref:Uncharacterized protein n=1 Tax=Pelobates cultripes TaxID=61616 RepID=A0AAD1SHM5_PELCU|nr:Hypothetical predicted protein [Pelobates cultripes]
MAKVMISKMATIGTPEVQGLQRPHGDLHDYIAGSMLRLEEIFLRFWGALEDRAAATLPLSSGIALTRCPEITPATTSTHAETGQPFTTKATQDKDILHF